MSESGGTVMNRGKAKRAENAVQLMGNFCQISEPDPFFPFLANRVTREGGNKIEKLLH